MPDRTQLIRATSATAGLVVGGAVAGGVVGAGWLMALGLAVDGTGGFPYVWDAFIIAGVVGAVLGGIAFPAVTWGYLRHVAFSRVVVYGACGTMLGGTIGALATGLSPLPAIGAAVFGFVCATLLLRWRNPPHAAQGHATSTRVPD